MHIYAYASDMHTYYVVLRVFVSTHQVSIHTIVLLLASMHTITRVYAYAHMNMHTS